MAFDQIGQRANAAINTLSRRVRIYGTTETGKLGKPASHGCVGLHPDNARTLFDLVRLNGVTSTRITISK